MCPLKSHSGLMFARSAPSVHCLISFLTSAPRLSGAPPTSVTSILAAAAFISGRASTLLISSLNLSITADGVLAGTITPVQASTTMLGKPDSAMVRSEEHTSELQSLRHLVCRLLLEKKKTH